MNEFFDVKVTDIITAIFTFAMAVFTFFLWRSTDKLWRAGENQIKLARDEFNATHRPKIRVRHFRTIPHKGGDFIFSPIDNNSCELDITNVGDATIKKIFISYVIMWANEVTEVADALESTPETESISLEDLPPGTGLKKSFQFKPLENISDLVKATEFGDFYFAGRVTYYDGLGVGRNTAFCRRCPKSNQLKGQPIFEQVRETDYEYED